MRVVAFGSCDYLRYRGGSLLPAHFLRAVWSQQGNGTGFICLRYKDQVGPGSWEDIPIQFPEQKIRVPNADEGDIYFTPNLFQGARRHRQRMLPSRWLYADLDETDPLDLDDKFSPSVAWESSPGRFQGLWLLARPLSPLTHETVNKALTYHVNADRSGWDATQVLRVPGTQNHKYADEPTVDLMWFTDDLLQGVKLPRPPYEAPGEIAARMDIPNVPRRALMRKYRDVLTLGTLHKLTTTSATGDRSRVLFRLERTMLEKGLDPGEIFILLRESVWNKFDSDKDLQQDILRAQARMG